MAARARADIVDVMLAVKARTYLFEAANARHEHEFAVWERVKLPTNKILAPGVVTHSTSVHAAMVVDGISPTRGGSGRV